MRARPYQLIFALLILSVLSVFILQAFWIRNFYLQKKEAFNNSIYAALEQVSTKLNEREHIRSLQQHIFPGQDKIQAGKKHTRLIAGSHAQVRTRKRPAEIRVMNTDSLKNRLETIILSDSVFTVVSAGATTRITRTSSSDNGVEQLVDKMIMEIKVLNTDERNADTIQSIIKRVLHNKGIFLPFEFALKKVFKDTGKTLARSPGFNDRETAFISDLSTDKVFSTHHYLFLQLPSAGGFVFTSVRNMLLLSLLFSLIIICVFYYTIRLILRQKKLGDIKNDFVNNMTHELKTPIATISLALDAIGNPLVKDDAQKFGEYSRILKEENQKLNRHVERVLQMALLDKGELQFHKAPADLVMLIRRAIEGHELHIRQRQALVNFRLPANAVFIQADELHVTNVFSNLLDNALKYASADCVIDIFTEQAHGFVQVHVKDNGIGIDANQQARIFEKFYRVQGGNLHDVKGFGLGLSYVWLVMQAHGGSVALKSEKGKGSEFIITFKTDAS